VLFRSFISFKQTMNLIKRASNLSVCRRFFSNTRNRDVMLRRAALFEEEKSRQLKEIERIDKIEIKVIEPGKECTLMMNKYISTPYNCALHLSELYANRSGLAKLDDEKFWDMHRPLDSDCNIQFLHFKEFDPTKLNHAYWRSCSFLLGYVLESAFKGDFFVDLCTNPHSSIKAGCFITDIKLNMHKWVPSRDELRCLSVNATQIAKKNLDFERIEVSNDVAQDIFRFNKSKLQQLSHLLKKQNNKKITLYKLGDFVDFETGPLISNTRQIGRYEVTAGYDYESKYFGRVIRFQGISIPSQLKLHYWTYNLLTERAGKKQLNTVFIKDEPIIVQTTNETIISEPSTTNTTAASITSAN